MHSLKKLIVLILLSNGNMIYNQIYCIYTVIDLASNYSGILVNIAVDLPHNGSVCNHRPVPSSCGHQFSCYDN